MDARLSIAASLFAIFCLLGQSAPAADRVLIEDEKLLERLGMAGAPGPVYATPSVARQLELQVPEVRQEDNAMASFKARWKRSMPLDYLSIGIPSMSLGALTHDQPGASAYSRAVPLWCSEGSFMNTFQSEISLPHGSLIEAMELWYYDDDEDVDVALTLRRDCFQTDRSADFTFLAQFRSSGAVPAIRHTLIDDIDEVVNARSCTHMAQVSLETCEGTLFSPSAMRFYRANVHHRAPGNEIFFDRFE